MAGHDAIHVRDYGMQASSDIDILERAREENRTIVSADSDFGVILACQSAAYPSFILLREPALISAADYVEVLLRALPLLEPELVTGCVAVFRRGRIRLRKLPFSD
jgi:predicted nuclease of predicted toxin-antitoxin system